METVLQHRNLMHIVKTLQSGKPRSLEYFDVVRIASGVMDNVNYVFLAGTANSYVCMECGVGSKETSTLIIANNVVICPGKWVADAAVTLSSVFVSSEKGKELSKYKSIDSLPNLLEHVPDNVASAFDVLPFDVPLINCSYLGDTDIDPIYGISTGD